MVVVGILSPALSFLSDRSEVLDSGDQCKISLNDTTKSRKQFKTTSGQSCNDSDLFNNPNFDTDTFLSKLAQIEVCAIKAPSTGSLCSKEGKEGREEGTHAE